MMAGIYVALIRGINVGRAKRVAMADLRELVRGLGCVDVKTVLNSGTPPLLGRTFTVGQELRDVAPEVVLSYGFWQRLYGGAPDVVGRQITLDGERFTVNGVMPEHVAVRTVELAESRAELWVPFSLVPGERTGMGGSLSLVARLAAGATIDQAQGQLSGIAGRLEDEQPTYSHDWKVGVVPLHEATVKDVRLVLLVLFGAVGILLLIACANVANLLLSRAAARQTELAIRLSLGATAGKLVRQFLTESLVLATAGGVCGVLLAVGGTSLLISSLPSSLDVPRMTEIHVDSTVLSFAVLLTFLTTIFFGLAPAISVAHSAPQHALRDTTRTSSPGRSRLKSILLVSEVALALILLAAAGLLSRSFWELSRVDPGFQPHQVVTMRTTLPASRYETDDRIRAFTRELLARLDPMPGARAVGLVNYLPLSRTGKGAFFEIEGRPPLRPEDPRGSFVSTVGGRYLETMGIPLLRGRLPSDADTEYTQPVFVIDEELARRHWPGEDPVGSHLVWRRGEGKTLTGEVIGVVGSVRWSGLSGAPNGAPNGTTYFWLPQDPDPQLTIVARAEGDSSALGERIAAVVGEIDPNQPVAEIRAMEDFVSADLAQPRFTLMVLGGFALAALLLAAIGLYGVIAFGVTERTQELGIRMALGAQHRDVVRLVMRRGLVLTGVGLAIGSAAALALGRIVASLLYGITPYDPGTLLAVGLLLTAIAMLATYLPARRATRLDPMLALRAE